MFFVAWPLNVFWVILIDDSWWVIWAHFNWTCLTSIRLNHEHWNSRVLQAGHAGCLCTAWRLCYWAAASHLHVCVQIVCLPACLSELFTWKLPFIIISTYDDVIFLYSTERERKLKGEREGGRKIKWKWRTVHRKESAPQLNPMMKIDRLCWRH